MQEKHFAAMEQCAYFTMISLLLCDCRALYKQLKPDRWFGMSPRDQNTTMLLCTWTICLN